MDVVVLTDRRYVNPTGTHEPNEGYVDNVLTEDRLVMAALARCGLQVERRAWCDDTMDWSATRAALFRTTWDYFDRWNDFSPWLREVRSQTRLFNAAPIVHWNLDKHYLQDLERQGVGVVPTAYVGQGEHLSLFEWMTRRGWSEVVIKPAVAGAAVDTYRITLSGGVDALSPAPPGSMDIDSLWHALVSKQDMLVQPFLPEVVTSGETSLIWVDGQVTHGVLKCAKPGDFRVQDDHGGTVQQVEVTSEDMALAQDIMSKCIRHCESQGWEAPLYARVDLMRDAQGQGLLSELELVEPELWFRFHPAAADLLAQAVQRRLSSPA